MPAVKNTAIEDRVRDINSCLNGIEIRAFENTNPAAARWCIQRWDADGPIAVEHIGSSLSALAWCEGFMVALDITNRT